MTSITESRQQQLSPGLAIKTPCRAASVGVLVLSGEQTVDAVACVDGDRVLVKNQASSIDNGIYVVSTGAWSRSQDFDGARDVVRGTFVYIVSGAVNGGAFYSCTTPDPVLPGTSALTFAQGALGPIAIPIPASNITFTQAGAAAVPLPVQTELRETLSPFQFGGVGDGVANDTAAILAASVAAVAQGKDVDFGGHTWLMGAQIALTAAHDNLHWRLRGATITKGFNGDLVTIVNCNNFSIDGVGIIDGAMLTRAGKGFVLSGAASHRFYIGPGILTKAFAGAHVEFGADSGYFSHLAGDMVGDASQATPTMIVCTGLDTSAMQRTFSGTVIGTISLTGAQATFVKGPLVNQVTIANTCSVTIVCGTTWSNNGNPITIDGANTIIVGCRMAGAVTINAGATGAYIGNRRTAGTFTNNSASMLVVGEDVITVPIGAAALPGLTPLGDPDTGFWQRVANALTLSLGGNDQFEFSTNSFGMGLGALIKWGNAATISGIGAFDTGFARKAAGVVEVNNGTAGTTQALKAYPVTDADALQTACLVRGGTGAPNNANGNNGDVYFRSDGGAGTTLYQKRAGAWVATGA